MTHFCQDALQTNLRTSFRFLNASSALLLLVLLGATAHAQASEHLKQDSTSTEDVNSTDAGSESSEEKPDSSSSGIYTNAQAERGRGLYVTNCEGCHASNLRGVDPFPSLTGSGFFSTWSGRPISELQQYISSKMPLGAPGSLDDQAYADILAFWLSKHGYPAGEQPIPADSAQLPETVIEDRRN